MKAVDSRVIVKVQKDALKTKIGGFEIAGAEEYDSAEVIAVGPKVENIEAGDRVYIYKGAGKMFKVEGTEYRTVALNEVIVVL